MARTVYWVSPHDGGWKVKREGADRAAGLFDLKSEAIDYAREVAKNNRPSQIKVQRRDGTIEDEWTYDDDPYPPPG